MNSSNVVAHKHKIVATAFKFFSGRLFCLYNNSPSFWHVCDRKCQWDMPGCRAIFSNSDDVRISQWNPITQMSCGERGMTRRVLMGMNNPTINIIYLHQ